MAITITPQMYLLTSLLIDNAIKVALATVSKMTPEEVNAGIIVEEGRKRQLMAEIDAH